MTLRTGAQLACDTLEALGVEVVFGLPGTQNLPLFEALRTSRIRTVVATHELGAGFMANGYARASGKVGVLGTIPGPGFTYALTALAEAWHDSAPVLHIAGAPAECPGRSYLLQALDQRAMAGPVVKGVFRIARTADLPAVLTEAHTLALGGEPGPVLVELVPGALFGEADVPPSIAPGGPEKATALEAAHAVGKRLRIAQRPLLIAGQGAAGGSRALRALAEALGCPVVTTLSGRGTFPEDHPLSLWLDMGGEGIHVLNEAIASADLVLALGCKFSHNGTGGFRLTVPAERLVHVDAAVEVLGANYPASLACAADVPLVLAALVEHYLPIRLSIGGWSVAEIGSLRGRAAERSEAGVVEPRIAGVQTPTPAAFLESVRRSVPRDTLLVTDSGLHQALARRHWRTLEPRGFIAPSDFQSMGFGIPAGIGASLATGHPVVVLTGDGGFNMAGLEILTAVRERVPLVVVVFNDGQFGLIRLQQLGDYGRTHGVGLVNPDYAGLAAALGADYALVQGDAGAAVGAALQAGRPAILEVLVGDSADLMLLRARSVVRETARRLLPTAAVGWLRRWRGR